MDDEWLPNGFKPAWSSGLPPGVPALSQTETAERLPEHGAGPSPEGSESIAESRPRANGHPAHPSGGDKHHTSNGARLREAATAEQEGPGRETPEQATAVMLERARAQARFEAARLREQAIEEAEQARAVMLERARVEAREEAERLLARARAEAARVKEVLLDEAREQAFYEGSRVRDQATAQAQEAIEEVQEAGAALVAEARLEADRIRQHAISESERVRAAIVEHAREVAESDAARRREEAVLEAEEAKATIIDLAREEAERVRAEAEEEKLAILGQAEDEAVRLHLEAAAQTGALSDGDGEATLLRASDIGSREFPEARRGFDQESVKKWLQLVETSYSTLEEELHRARREWERALEMLEVTNTYLGSVPGWDGRTLHAGLQQQLEVARAAWERSMHVLSTSCSYRPEYDLPSLLVRSAHLETRLGRRLYGYSASQVQHLLEELTTELARLQNHVGALRAENEELRGRLLAHVAKPTGERVAVFGLRPPGALLPQSALRAPSEGNGSAQSAEEVR